MNTISTADTLRHVDPKTLVIDSNVREADAKAVAEDTAFVAHIKEHGVLQPISAHEEADGLHVQMGQRRTLAAVLAELSTVPVYITQKREDVARVVTQLGENDHRAGISQNDRRAAVEQLTAFGLSAEQIARTTHRPKGEVETAQAVNASTVATKAMSTHALTLDQAQVLTEFEADKKVTKTLLTAAKNGGFDHAAQRARDDRDSAAAHAEAVDTLTEAGVPVVEAPGYYDKDTKALSGLRHTGAEKALTVKEHASCPGHVAWLQVQRNSGEGPRYTARITHGCNDWRKQGHKTYDPYGSNSTKPAADTLTDAQREEAKAERREVIENNKAWDAAETVRREWLKTFLTRKTPPKGTAKLLATALFGGYAQGARMDDQKSAELVRLLGLTTTVPAITKGTDNRASVLTLGYALAAYEGATGRGSWRNPDSRTGVYLRFLAANGYELSDVEKIAAGGKTKK